MLLYISDFHLPKNIRIGQQPQHCENLNSDYRLQYQDGDLDLMFIGQINDLAYFSD